MQGNPGPPPAPAPPPPPAEAEEEEVEEEEERTKPNNSSSIPETHMVEGEDSLKLSSDLHKITLASATTSHIKQTNKQTNV